MKIAFRRIPNMPDWVLSVLQPLAVYNGQSRAPIITLIFWGTTVLAAALLFALRRSSRVLQPISLKQQAEDAAAGGGIGAMMPEPTAMRLFDVTEFEDLREVIGGAGSVLRDSERRLRALAEDGAAAVWRATSDGKIIESRGWEVLTGLSHEEIQNNGWAAALHPDNVSSTFASWQEVMAARKPIAVEHRVRTRDGAWLWHHARGGSILDQHGETEKWVGVVADVHERKIARAA